MLRALARRDVRWGRVAAVSTAGLVVGVASTGVAAPLIGAALGGALGLSGAACDVGRAGRARWRVGDRGWVRDGRRDRAAVGVGRDRGAGVGAVGARLSGFSASQVVAAAVKLDVVARMVLLDAENDEAKARLVVEGLQARLDEVGATIGRAGRATARLLVSNSGSPRRTSSCESGWTKRRRRELLEVLHRTASAVEA